MGVTGAAQYRFDFRPSRLLGLALLLTHGLAMLSIIVLPLPFLMRAVLLLVPAANLWHVYRKVGGGAVGLRIESDRIVVLDARSGEVSGKLLPDSLVTPYLAVLQIHTEGKPRSVLVMPDSLDAQSFRRLRILLRWQDRIRL